MATLIAKKYWWWVLIFLLLVYLSLAYKNPFEARSLVANMEPYPDTLYYSAPGWNFVHGKGFNMRVFDWEAQQVVPPLYSLFLVPFFAFFGDVRSFYLANLLLAFGSISFFTFFLRKIFKDNLITITFLGVLMVTNFYFYSLPSFLMAENISLFFLMSGLYLLTIKTNRVTAVFLAVWGVLFWLIKLANLPLGLVFITLATFKILREKSAYRVKKIYFFCLFTSLAILFFYMQKTGILMIRKGMGETKAFSLSYFLPNLKLYLLNLFGGETRFLWMKERLILPVLNIAAVIGLVLGFFKKGFRLIAIQLLLFIVVLVVFMSFFYAQDARYILVIFPLLLTSIGFLLNKRFSLILILLLTFVIFFVKNFGYRQNERLLITLKKQVSLNLKYKEDPWNYLAVQEFNRFFNQRQYQKSYLGTFLPPFYVNFFYNKKFRYLPLIESQDFFSEKNGFLEQMKISNINSYYKELLKNNQSVFVSNYYSANLRLWQQRFESLKNDFDLELKQRGCYDVCNIYELKIK